MKKVIWIATANKNKVKEFQKILTDYEVKCLRDLDFDFDVEETGQTFEENALIKARALYECIKQPLIAEDSGFCVDAMDGLPGIYAHRWMGEDTSYDIKNQEIIRLVEGKERTCRYVAAIAYIDEEGKEHTYLGTCEGEIYTEQLGTNGFAYDPIFYYPPFKTTLANVSDEEKNSISHRAKAIELFLADFNK